jgi:hypothetical protein
MPEERRRGERRSFPGQQIDVTRLEHENLCRQIDEVLRSIRRIEAELRTQADRIAVLESSVAFGRRNAS